MSASELQVIGQILTDNTLLDELECYTDINDFQDETAFGIVQNMRLLSDQNKEINIVTLSELYNNDPETIRFLANCQTHTTGTFRSHALNVHEKACERRLHQAIGKAQEILLSPHTALETKLDQCNGLFLDVINNKQDTLLSPREQLERFANDLLQRSEAKGYLGLETPWSNVTQALGGMNKGEMYTIAARPGMGKTNFALNLFTSVVKRGKSCLYISLEMTSEELLARLASDWANVDYSKFNRAELSEFDWASLSGNMFDPYRKNSAYIDDSSTHTVGTIRAKARRVKKAHGLDMIIVDHIGLIDHGHDNETIGLGKISREMKRMAKDMECPVVVLSQLNRDCEKRNNKRPMLSDLRQSGSIEQDSDAVAFLYRDEYYNDDSANKGLCEVIFAKVRKGQRGTQLLETQFHKCRFIETSRESVEEDNFSSGIGF